MDSNNVLKIILILFLVFTMIKSTNKNINKEKFSAQKKAQDMHLLSCTRFRKGRSKGSYQLIASTDKDNTNQTLIMNITSLPKGRASVKVIKSMSTTGSANYISHEKFLKLGLNTITGNSSYHNDKYRQIIFEFSSGDVFFDSLTLNGVDFCGIKNILKKKELFEEKMMTTKINCDESCRGPSMLAYDKNIGTYEYCPTDSISKNDYKQYKKKGSYPDTVKTIICPNYVNSIFEKLHIMEQEQKKILEQCKVDKDDEQHASQNPMDKLKFDILKELDGIKSILEKKNK